MGRIKTSDGLLCGGLVGTCLWCLPVSVPEEWEKRSVGQNIKPAKGVGAISPGFRVHTELGFWGSGPPT
jgi:hypothetical protein